MKRCGGEWDELSQRDRLASKPLGGAFLRSAWDADTADQPLPTVVLADEALPEFRFDMLHQVTFVRVLPAPRGPELLMSTGTVMCRDAVMHTVYRLLAEGVDRFPDAAGRRWHLDSISTAPPT